MGGMRFYPSFHQRYETYPDLSITMKTGSTGFIEDKVLQGHLDIAYVLGHPKQKNLQYIHKADDELVIIGKNTINHNNLAGYLNHQNILASEQCCYSTALNQIYRNYQLTKDVTTQIFNHEALIQFTQLGMEVSMLAKSLLNKFDIQYYVDAPQQYRDIGLYLIARNNHVFTPIEKQFVGLNDQL